MPRFSIVAIPFVLMFCSQLQAQTLSYPTDAPRPIPLMRPEMKQALEDVKQRIPRIPLPELTEKDRQQLGDLATSYEARLKFHYLDGDDWSRRRGSTRTNAANSSAAARTSQQQDPAMTLDRGFKVELFWIVSRTNNCQYCLGHQETKLLAAGRSEQRIALLDGDWSVFSPAEQAAFAFARKFSYQPHRLVDDDIEALRAHYTDLQILEMILSMAWNNSINRWKEGVGVPQRTDEGGYSRALHTKTADAADDSQPPSLPHGSYLTPTPQAYRSQLTRVAPVAYDPQTGLPTRATVAARPPLESHEQLERELQRCRQRTSRLPLLDEPTTRERLSLEPGGDEPTWNWMRLLALFPKDGVSRARSILEIERNDELTPLLKAQLSWIVARDDRAWYALGHAQRRLRKLGQSEEQTRALDGGAVNATPSERALYRVARHLAASPVVLTDEEVAEAVELAGAATVTQAIRYVTHLVAFNRITEAAGLPLE